jgi:hypothetical protein
MPLPYDVKRKPQFSKELNTPHESNVFPREQDDEGAQAP